MSVVLGIMFLMGIVGGSINMILAGDDALKGLKGWGKAVVLGIGAAILIPLFLNTIESDLLKNVLAAPELGADALIFAGFCLIAAISSRQFIRTLSDRVTALAQDAKKAADEAKKQVENANETAAEALETAEQAAAGVTEPELAPADGTAQATASDRPDDASRALLTALDNSKYTLRSVWGISQQVQRPVSEVRATLEQLEGGNLVMRVQGKKGERWTLTAAGRAVLST